MGKFGTVNFDVKVNKKLSKLMDDKRYYVDGVKGSDTNDGLTVATAFKTIQAATSRINGMMAGYVTLYIRSGTYNEPLTVYDFNGTLFVDYIANEGKIIVNGVNNISSALGVFSPCYIGNSNAKIMISNMNFNPDGMSEVNKAKLVSLAYVVNASDVSFHNCEFNGSALHNPATSKQHPVGVYAVSNSKVTTSECVYRNLGIPLYANSVSEVLSARSTFTNISDGYAAMHGGIVTGSRMTTDNNTLPKAVNGQLFSIDHISDNAVAESGSNANGSYIKYANGDIILNYFRSQIPISELRDENGALLLGLRFLLMFPHQLTSIKSANVTGYVTNSGGGFFEGVFIKPGSIYNNGIYAFIDNGKSSIPTGATHIFSLSYTVIGRWK